MTPQEVQQAHDEQQREAAMQQLSHLAHFHLEDVDWDVLDAVAEFEGGEEDGV